MPASLTPRTLAILTAAFIGAIFVFAGVYTATQHEPTPHQLRVGAVGEDTALKLQLALSLPPNDSSYFDIARYETADDLTTAIKERKIYAGFTLNKKQGELFVAPAAGKVLSDNLVSSATKLMAAAGTPLKVTEVVPLGKGDTSGLSSYTFQYGLLVPSFVFAILLFMFAHGVSMAWRLGLTAAYAVGAGLVGAFTVDMVIGALEGHFLALAGLGMLYAATAVLAAYGLSAMFGYAGAALAGLALIVVGNGVGGGSVNQEFLPDFFRSLGQAFPNGAFIRAVRNVVYFEGHNIGQALLVVLLWALGGLALALAAKPVRAFVAKLWTARVQPEPAATK